MKSIIAIFLMFLVNDTYASVLCSGKIHAVYKWDSMDTLSIILNLDGEQKTRWINMPTKSDESMALMAFASNKPVRVYMSEENITECVDGWSHNKPLVGYFIVLNS